MEGARGVSRRNADSGLEFAVLGAEVVKLLKEIEFLNQEHRFFQALKKLTMLEMLVERLSRLERSDERDALLSTVTGQQLRFAALKEKCAGITALRDELCDESWSQVNKTTDYTVLYKSIPETPLHKIRIEGVIPCPVEHVVALVFELDLYSTWVPSMMGVGLKKSYEVAHIERLMKIGHFIFGLPWPLRDCDIVVQGYGVDLLQEHGQLMLILENCVAHEKADVPHADEATKRIELISGGGVFKPLSLSSTHVCYYFCVDPQMSYVPAWLINFLLKTFAGLIWNKLKNAAMNIGRREDDPHTQRMAAHCDVYSLIRERVNDSLAVKGKGKEEGRNEGDSDAIVLVTSKTL